MVPSYHSCTVHSYENPFASFKRSGGLSQLDHRFRPINDPGKLFVFLFGEKPFVFHPHAYPNGLVAPNVAVFVVQFMSDC